MLNGGGCVCLSRSELENVLHAPPANVLIYKQSHQRVDAQWVKDGCLSWSEVLKKFYMPL